MSQPSVSDAAVSTTAPELYSVPSTPPSPSAMAMDRRVVFGAQPQKTLPAFTLSTRLRGRHLLLDTDLTPDEIGEVLDTAARIKAMQKNGQPHSYLAGKTLGLIFQHPSTRTRVSLEAGMAQLGGQAIFLGVNDLQMKRGETIGDTSVPSSKSLVTAVQSFTDRILTLGKAEPGDKTMVDALLPFHRTLTDAAALGTGAFSAWEQACRAATQRAAERSGLEVQAGKMVFELKPRGGDKGAAVRTLSRPLRASWNQWCWSEQWLSTKSAITRRSTAPFTATAS